MSNQGAAAPIPLLCLGQRPAAQRLLLGHTPPVYSLSPSPQATIHSHSLTRPRTSAASVAFPARAQCPAAAHENTFIHGQSKSGQAKQAESEPIPRVLLPLPLLNSHLKWEAMSLPSWCDGRLLPGFVFPRTRGDGFFMPAPLSCLHVHICFSPHKLLQAIAILPTPHPFIAAVAFFTCFSSLSRPSILALAHTHVTIVHIDNNNLASVQLALIYRR